MKAIGYIRFSTKKQEEGSSIERQTETIEKYCREKGLDLVEKFLDDGFSGDGEHMAKGKLGTIIFPAIDAGKYPLGLEIMNDYWNDPPEEPEYDDSTVSSSLFDTREEYLMDWPIEDYIKAKPKCLHGNPWGCCDKCDFEGDLAYDAAREKRS